MDTLNMWEPFDMLQGLWGNKLSIYDIRGNLVENFEKHCLKLLG